MDDGGALSVGGQATGTEQNADNHQVHETDDATRVDVDHSFNDHQEQSVASHNNNDGHFTTDSHDEVDDNAFSNNTLHDVHPV